MYNYIKPDYHNDNIVYWSMFNNDYILMYNYGFIIVHIQTNYGCSGFAYYVCYTWTLR